MKVATTHAAFPAFAAAPPATTIVDALAMLADPQPARKGQAVNALIHGIDQYWPEIAQQAAKLELLAQDASFAQAATTRLLLAKLHFHLGAYAASVTHALHAGDAFNIDEPSAFAETILAEIIDRYTAGRAAGQPAEDGEARALAAVFARVVRNSIARRELRPLVGLAIDCRQLDLLDLAVGAAESPTEATQLLAYAKDCCLGPGLGHGSSTAFRRDALLRLSSLLQQQPAPDAVLIAECLLAAEQPVELARVLSELLRDGHAGLAAQIAFNVEADAPQGFCGAVLAQLPQEQPAAFVRAILDGTLPGQLRLEFLARANHGDAQILERTRAALSAQASLHQQALACAAGIMQAGTAGDGFQRTGTDFVAHASNWAKFSATAGLGAVHRGQGARGRALLAAYLPGTGTGGSAYSEGGALLALGLMQTSGSAETVAYLQEQLQAAQSEVLQHGACLGLGAASAGTHSSTAADALRAVLFADSATAGEAAALGLGLAMLGSGDAALAEELHQYARETQHERVIRALGTAIALGMLGCRERADALALRLGAERDPLLRHGAAWTVALAHAGTGSSAAVRQLLHLAVGDACDDVRRAAVTGLGFVLCRAPLELLPIAQLLAHSHNPSVRYGTAMALGVAFAGSASRPALALLQPLARDPADFVRQAALIAAALVLMQHAPAPGAPDLQPPLRAQLDAVVGARHEDPLARLGAVLAQGILDAGGRNARLALLTPAGHVAPLALAGTALFCQLWHWYPLAHFLALALQPTALVALCPPPPGTTDPRIPGAFAALCQAPPSRFAYPDPVKAATAAQPRKLVAAVLSTTAKAAARAKKLAPAPADLPMDVDASADADADADAEAVAAADAPPAEGNFHTVPNFARVTPAQLPLMLLPSQGERFLPVSPHPWRGGILVLHDSAPAEPAEWIALQGGASEPPAKDAEMAEAQTDLVTDTSDAPDAAA